jgi:hypothetical protein
LLLLFAPHATSQTKLTSTDSAPSDSAQVLKVSVTREAARNEFSANPAEQIEQASIAHVIAERQAQLRRDTEKLVALTAELKQHVDKSGPNILSMDVIKKAAEIQKLAKSVEDKMKNAY